MSMCKSIWGQKRNKCSKYTAWWEALTQIILGDSKNTAQMERGKQACQECCIWQQEFASHYARCSQDGRGDPPIMMADT